MKPSKIILVAVMLAFSLFTNAGASLIGDQVTIQYLENNVVLDEARDIIVSDQNDDIRLGIPDLSLELLSVDIQANTIRIDFLRFNQYIQGNTNFHGIKILDLDWNDPANPDWILLNAEVTINTMTSSGLWYAEEDARMLIDPVNGDISFNWHQMSYQRNQNFTAMLEFGPNPIPIPATMALFVTGLIGFILIRRRKKT